MKTEQASFWLTNISNRNVSLTDLNLTVKAYNSVNLLDKKHYTYTLEQLKKSVESGSVFKKKDKLVVRKIAPAIIKDDIKIQRAAVIPSRERSVLTIKDENYAELELSDEEFIEDTSTDIAADNQSFIKKV